MVSGDGRALVLKSAIRNKSEIFRIERRPASGALNAEQRVCEFALAGVDRVARRGPTAIYAALLS